MKYLIYLLPFISGITITTQAGVNSQLRFSLNSPIMAAFVSFLVGTVVLGVILLATKQPAVGLAQLKNIELYKFAGGLLGAFFVSAIIITVPKLGSANVFALVIAGQLFTGLLFDHFGLLGFPQNSVNWTKVLGILLVISGAYLINKK